ncbi:AMP-binding protein [Delftia tsuruhatensis]|uniref:AMP-binding protein n=1 Tax=Delftia tsuruhatensis TaxID=180282 RepID=UPI001E734F2F|nr:AMP-binding protein [Delftia tsuruhatensis]CAC9693706.1 Linear gramicidin synthase subunit A [Delftia tsuruhatensis]
MCGKSVFPNEKNQRKKNTDIGSTDSRQRAQKKKETGVHDFHRWADARPDRIALTMGDSGEQHTAGALARRSREIAQWMAGQGLAAGDTVAVLMENRVEILELVLAARLAGLYAVVISTHLTAPEVAYILGDSGRAMSLPPPPRRRSCRLRWPPTRIRWTWTARPRACRRWPMPWPPGARRRARAHRPVGPPAGARPAVLLGHHGPAQGASGRPCPRLSTANSPTPNSCPGSATWASARTRSTCRPRRCTTRRHCATACARWTAAARW